MKKLSIGFVGFAIVFANVSFAKEICFRGEENENFIVKFATHGLRRTVSIYDQNQAKPLLVTAKLKRRLDLFMGHECDMALAFDRDGEAKSDVLVEGFDGNKYLFDIGFASMSVVRCLMSASIPTRDAGDTFDGIDFVQVKPDGSSEHFSLGDFNPVDCP